MRYVTKTIVMSCMIGLFATNSALAADQLENEQQEKGFQAEGRQQAEPAGQPQTEQQEGGMQAEGEQQSNPVDQPQQSAVEELDSEQIRRIQQTLQKQGADPGPADGIMGIRTEQALREFQQKKGLPVTGRFTRQTLEALRLEEESMEVAPGFEINRENRIGQQNMLPEEVEQL